MFLLLTWSLCSLTNSIFTHIWFIWRTSNCCTTIFNGWDTCTFTRAILKTYRAGCHLRAIVNRLSAWIIAWTFNWPVYRTVWDGWAVFEACSATTIRETMIRECLRVRTSWEYYSLTNFAVLRLRTLLLLIIRINAWFIPTLNLSDRTRWPWRALRQLLCACNQITST